MKEQIEDFVRALAPCYDLYVALHESKRSHDKIFTDDRCNVILTAIMGGHDRGWRVVGITRQALQYYVTNNYVHKSGNGIQRGHIVPRIETAKRVMAPELPMTLEELARLWYEVDTTVLCARGENKATLPTDYILFDNPQSKHFKGKRVGWYQTKADEDLLRSLASSHGMC